HNVAGIPATGSLRFAGSADSAALLASALSITDDIDLHGTGILGLTRDGGTVDPFTGTFDGNDHTVTLAIGEIYGLESSGAAASESSMNRGAGRIYMHTYTGLFGRTTGATISDLTVDGTISVFQPVDNSTWWYIGGIVGRAAGNLTLDHCSVAETITEAVGAGKPGVCIGGAVGDVADQAAGAVTITGGEYRATIVDKRTAYNENSYYGGVIGRVNSMDAAGSSYQIDIAVSDVTLAGAYNNSAASNKNYPHYGGLIGFIRPNNSNTVKRTLSIQDVTVADMNIAVSSNEGSGGLLGYLWLDTDVTIGTSGASDGLTIGASGDDSASPTVAFTPLAGSDAMAGGLVFGATGHWIINHLDAQNVTFSTTAANADFGFVAARGVIPGPFSVPSALFLEIAGNVPAKYDLSGVKVSGSGFDVFDEVVAYTVPLTTSTTNNVITATPKPITDNGAAVVSMHTADGAGVKMDGTNCNTYQNQTAYGKTNLSVNPHSRYYYNLDLIRAKGSPTAPEKLLLWSLNKYSHSTIRKYFTDHFGSTITGAFDMTGVTYYPVTASGVRLNNATVKFYNEAFEQSEQVAGGDSLARSSRARTQHDLFHCGILYDASNITVTNLTLQGTVGTDSDAGSGFLVRGTLHDAVGKYTDVSNVTLDGALVRSGAATPAGVPSGYAPLLINRVGSSVASEPTNFSLSHVSTANYAAAATAGSSLIGSVTGIGIQLTFSDMRLDARTGALSNGTTDGDLTAAYGTTQSLFTRATLLQSFTYTDSNSDGRYNYNLDEDWSGASPVHHVTYGKEINGSVEYSSIAQDEYFDCTTKTNPDSDSGGAYNFNNSDWLPYVATAYSAVNHTHELRINQKLASFEDGCGKYDDPYMITDGGQLVSVAQIIRGEAVDSSFALVLPDSLTPNTAHTASGAGSQANDETYTYDGGNFVNAGHTRSYTFAQVREYLAGAYYTIAQDITIPDTTFTGLGAVNTAFTNYVCAYAFRGVIDGNMKTIRNESSAPLIANSNGAVVKNLRLTAKKPYTFTQNNASNNTTLTFQYNGGLESYGAVIGKVMGGDTFIDNVNVTFDFESGEIVGSGTATHLVPIGGYIGVVVNGGVIFRNMPEGAGSGTASVCSYVGDSGYLYANPVIGRVLMGYAFSEGANTVNNGTKNYDIPRLDPNAGSMLDLSVVDSKNTASVPNGQAMWVLGAAINSGAASASSATAAYDTIEGSSQIWSAYRNYAAARSGATDGGGNYVYNDANYGNAADGKTPYILTQYATGALRRRIGALANVVLNVTGDCAVPSGFRGLGSIYKDNTNLHLTAATVDGNDHTVTLNMNYSEFDTQKTGENYKANANVAGFGLINSVRQNFTASDLTIGGSIFYDIRKQSDGTAIRYAARTGNGSNAVDLITDGAVLSAGGLAGQITSGTTTISDVNMNSLTLEGAKFVGGLIGRTTRPSTINRCGGDGVNIRAGLQGGGLVGMFNGNVAATLNGIDGSGNPTVLNNLNLYLKTWRGDKTENQDNVAAIGGLLGTSINNTLNISNYKISNGSMSAFYPAGNNETTVAGGAVGVVRKNLAGSIISNFTVENENIESPIAGGIVGLNHGGSKLTIQDSQVIATSGAPYLRAQRIAGGVIGSQRAALDVDGFLLSDYDVYIFPGATNWERDSAGGVVGFAFENGVDVRNVKIEECNIFTNNAISNNDVGAAGGVFGHIKTVNVTGANILVNDTEITNYQSVLVDGDSYIATNALSKSFGAIAGWKANTTNYVKLVGVSVIDCGCHGGAYTLLPVGIRTGESITREYGTDGYAIFADFAGAATENTANTDEGMLYSALTDAAAEMPYVTVNPAVTIDEEGNFLTSDGMATDDTEMPIRAILTAGANGYTVAWNKSGITKSALAGRLSTFKTENAISDSSPDFGVFVIEASTKAVEVTQVLNSYLDFLTNTAIDYADPDAID
ncbi:MAG: hypothetical protein IKN53_05595, partial [Oscillibacter sp.]|nr:hypothetical protein [Oscillibacter sp.]